MSLSVRARRLGNEWAFLARLVEHNPGVLDAVKREAQPDADFLHVVLHRTSALSLGTPPKLREGASHAAWFRYPEYYPSVPIEAFLSTPVFHPNVHPETGFVCLWSHHSAGDTILEAVRQLQRVITWELTNSSAEHLMQPEALQWVPDVTLPLEYQPVHVPVDLQLERSYARNPASSRRRLTE
jgi:ubiquitin-protein ligase